MDKGRDALIQFFERQIPFNAHLGMTVESLEAGRCVIAIPFRDHYIGDPFRPALHGGLLSTLGDTAGGLAVFSTLTDYEARVSTVDLRVDYLRPGRSAEVRCEASLVRAGNRVAVTRMVVFQAAAEGETEPWVVAECRGVYNIRGPKRPGEKRS